MDRTPTVTVQLTWVGWQVLPLSRASSIKRTPHAGNRRPQRERQALGRAPQRSPAVELMQRGPRAPTSGFPSSGAPHVLPPRATADADTQAVLKALRGLGLFEDLIGQVARCLQPPVGKKVSSRGWQMAHFKEQLHNLRGRIARCVVALRKHIDQSDLMVAKLNACYQEEASMDAQYRELGAKKLTPSSSLARSPAVSVVDHDDLKWANECDGVDADMDQDGCLEGGPIPHGQPSGRATFGSLRTLTTLKLKMVTAPSG